MNKSSFFLALFILLTCFNKITAQFSGGSGTQADPYQIATPDDLKFLSESPELWNKYFIQTDNIDASVSAGWNNGMGAIPIGNETVLFTGSFDGNNYTISNYTINRDTFNYVGFFGYSGSPGKIRNIRLINCSITGKSYVGGLVGRNLFAEIENCQTSGTINGKDSVYARCGGLVGANTGKITNSHSSATVVALGDIAGGLAGMHANTMEKCYATGTVTGLKTVGGLVGISAGTIIASYAKAQVTGSNKTGGFVGDLSTNGTIQNCYSGSTVINQYYAGGFVGYISGNNASISKCYSNGTLSNTTGFAQIGGFAGAASATAVVSNSFWDTDISGTFISAGGEGKTTEELIDPATYLSAGWDFVCETSNGTNDIWGIQESQNNGYPFLLWQGLVYDSESPTVISYPSHDTIYVQENCGILLPDYRSYIIASDNCTPAQNLIILQAPETGTLAGIGQTELTFTLKDASGNMTVKSAIIEVMDTTRPEIVCPENQERILSSGSDTYPVVGNEFDLVSVTDNCSLGSVSNTLNLLSSLAGTELGPGITTVTWTAEDGSGNMATCAFNINVAALSDVKEIKEPLVSVYPNPARNYIQIEVADPFRQNIVELYDGAGRRVYMSKFSGNVRIPLTGLPNGIYQVRIGNANRWFLWNVVKIN